MFQQVKVSLTPYAHLLSCTGSATSIIYIERPRRKSHIIDRFCMQAYSMQHLYISNHSRLKNRRFNSVYFLDACELNKDTKCHLMKMYENVSLVECINHAYPIIQPQRDKRRHFSVCPFVWS
jgi:hypothetical protein